jgi:integrase
MPEDLRIEAAKCMERLAPFGKTLTQAVDYFIPYLERTSRPKLLADLVQEAIAEKQKKGMKKPTIAEFKSRCKQLTAAFPGRESGSISTEEIETWLAHYEHPVTFNNSRKAVLNLFNFAIRKSYLPSNPAAPIDRREEGDNEIEILSPKEMAALLLNSTFEILPYFALGGFAGIRPEELQKLEWEDVKQKAGIIRIRETVSNKTGARNVTIQPNLALWLEPYRKLSGKICTPSWRRIFRATRIAAGITRWPDDCLRHSFAAYLLEIQKDAPALALEMGNSVEVILDRYAKPLDEPDDAVEFWTMVPDSMPQPQDARLQNTVVSRRNLPGSGQSPSP